MQAVAVSSRRVMLCKECTVLLRQRCGTGGETVPLM